MSPLSNNQCHGDESPAKLRMRNEKLSSLKEEFDRLLNQHARSVFVYILSLVFDRTAAEDVFQDTCFIMWKKFAEFEPGTNFAAWGRGIARYRALKYREQQSSQLVLMSDNFIEAISQAQTSRSEDDLSRREALAGCIKKLRVRDQELLSRRYSCDTTTKCLAEELGRPVETVYKSLGRIRRTLLVCVRRTLAQEG